MNVHHGEDCCRLCEIEADIEAVANMHMNSSRASERKALALSPNELSPAFVPAA
jgi:hypothetical protein